MILYREGIDNIVQRNCIMLDIANEEAVIFVSRNTYDQALLIEDRFDGDYGLVKAKLDVGESRAELIDYFYERMPSPINILAPFIGMIEEDVMLKKETRQLCGMIHQLSQIVDFNEVLKVDKAIRASVRFGRRLLMDYEKAWEDLLIRVSGASTVEGERVIVTKEVVDEEVTDVSEAEDPWAMFNASMAFMCRSDEESEDDREEEVTEVIEEVVEEVSSDDLMNLMMKLGGVENGK